MILLLIRPFAAPATVTAEDVAQAWNESISRLGILPVFPPEEDLHVGDLWAVIASDAEGTPLLGKAVRLAHIDLRDLMHAAQQRQPRFPDTAARAAGDEFRRQPLIEVPPEEGATDAIRLTLAAFPGITIRHSRRIASASAPGWLSFGAARDELEEEEIRILLAETYGVSAAAAAGRLDEWCSAVSTRLLCTDAFARRTLALAVSKHVLEARDGRHTVPLQLRLVTRVFLMREIEQNRIRDSGADARAGAVAPNSTPGGASAGAALAEASFRQAGRTGITLRQVFERPVVFGFRAVTVALPPSSPPSEPEP
ncbi:hypothetical protein E0493_21800 [Roseomonas sp. M0104]|uniref:Uncharacterized protein n=1 Tax=Teichococcus coralli TaxID=2545983 RepID=A0A845BG48_9PROT|nr:hypothetical protein [Pseudoroseomonas coralli]MXP65985.1 hypothetical protein [Pseudoroseomonas coralli]